MSAPPGPGRTVTCVCGCGRTGRHYGRGLVMACWNREQRNRNLDRYPRTTPEPTPRPMRLVSESVAGRVADYAELRSWGVSLHEAAARLGVTSRTAHRYESHLRATTTAQEEATAA